MLNAKMKHTILLTAMYIYTERECVYLKVRVLESVAQYILFMFIDSFIANRQKNRQRVYKKVQTWTEESP